MVTDFNHINCSYHKDLEPQIFHPRHVYEVMSPNYPNDYPNNMTLVPNILMITLFLWTDMARTRPDLRSPSLEKARAHGNTTYDLFLSNNIGF